MLIKQHVKHQKHVLLVIIILMLIVKHITINVHLLVVLIVQIEYVLQQLELQYLLIEHVQTFLVNVQ